MKNMNIARRAALTVAAVLISSLVLTQAVDARPNREKGAKRNGFQQAGFRGGSRGGRGADFGFFLGDLSLSDDQKAQMQEKWREFQLATEETNLRLRFARRDLGAAMRDTQVDQAKVDGLWAEIAELRQAQAKARVEQYIELRQILTEEQLATLQARENEWRELQILRSEYRKLLLASGETDVAKLQELQTQITEKELALEKEHAEKRAAFQNEFVQSRSGRRGPKGVK